MGSCISRRLLDAGSNQVILVDNGQEPRNRWIESQFTGDPNVTIRRWGIEEVAAEMVPQVDYVIHCAASTGIPYSLTAPLEDWKNNVDATLMLLEALRETPKPTVVLSSIKPYRVLPMPLNGLDESTVLEPDEPYAASKASQSMLTQAYARSYGLPITTFRCSNLYGPAPCHGARHGWLTHFCISAATGRPIEVQGTGEQSRDMLHGNDVTNAVLRALQALDNTTDPGMVRAVKGEVFNLGGGIHNIISVNQAANLLHELTGVEIRSAPARAMDDHRVFVDTAKYRAATGWTPKVNVVDGLRDTLAWAQRNKAALLRLYAEA